MRLVFAPRALRDIDRILAYVRARSPRGARNVSIAIENMIGLCALNPYLGAKTDEPNVYRSPLSKFRYTIFYRVDAAHDVVEIARVVHGARVRDLRRLPGEEG